MAVEPRQVTDAERWFRERFSSTPERDAVFTTISGEPVEPLYTPEDVAIDTLDDMETLFAGIDMGAVSTSMTINAPAAVMLAFYIVAAERQGAPPEQLAGTIQTDILKEYIAQKEWCFPIDPAMRLVTDMVEWCTTHMPRWHPISISGYHIREAGSNAAQEPAFPPKDGFTNVERAPQR